MISEIQNKTFSGIKIAIATRIHEQETLNPINLSKIKDFCEKTSMLVHQVIIAVDISGENGEKLLKNIRNIAEAFSNLIILPISPWGKFCPALNAIVSYACKAQIFHLVFQSIEASITAEVLKLLLNELDDSSLVVGAAFKGHNFNVGIQPLNGCTSPWNTLALWSVPKLANTGFLLIADGIIEGIEGGIEEVSAIALLQKLYPDNCKAKLLKIENLEWNTEFDDIKRRHWHEKKMESKLSRAKLHLEKLCLESGTVEHIETVSTFSAFKEY